MKERTSFQKLDQVKRYADASLPETVQPYTVSASTSDIDQFCHDVVEETRQGRPITHAHHWEGSTCWNISLTSSLGPYITLNLKD